MSSICRWPSFAGLCRAQRPRRSSWPAQPRAGTRGTGRVARHRPGVHPTAIDRVLLARTLLPTELPLISAIAIVSETGGPLDHIAAQARERGIPAVVGAHGASSVFADGDLVLVDGDAGLVVKIL